MLHHATGESSARRSMPAFYPAGPADGSGMPFATEIQNASMAVAVNPLQVSAGTWHNGSW